MQDRTVICEGCGEPFAAQPLGKLPTRCLTCVSPKLRAQRLRRAAQVEPDVRCSGPCGRALASLRPVPGLDAFCAQCGPGPGTTRRSTCQGCGAEVWRSHRGGGHAPRRFALCDECAGTQKWCNRCETVKPHTSFSTAGTKRLALQSMCRACASEIHHMGDKLERVAKKFGMTKEHWLELFNAQGGRCAICRAEPKDRPRGYLMVDHDHDCCPGQTSCGSCVRGLLCLSCNVSLGGFRDSRANLRAALAYLDSKEVPT